MARSLEDNNNVVYYDIITGKRYKTLPKGKRIVTNADQLNEKDANKIKSDYAQDLPEVVVYPKSGKGSRSTTMQAYYDRNRNINKSAENFIKQDNRAYEEERIRKANHWEGLMNVLSPGQYFGAAIDALQGERSFGDALWYGNSGWVTDEFARNNPRAAVMLNLLGDTAVGVGGKYGQVKVSRGRLANDMANTMRLKDVNSPIVRDAVKQALPYPHVQLRDMVTKVIDDNTNKSLTKAQLAKEINKAVKDYNVSNSELPDLDIKNRNKSRIKIGDVEINDPNLNYRQGRQGLVKDFQDSGKVRIYYDEAAKEARTKKPGVMLLQKSFEKPMFKQRGLWYDGWLEDTPWETPNNSDLLVTREPLAYATKGGNFAKVDLAGRRIPFTDDQLNSSNTTAYVYEPGYGFRKVGSKTSNGKMLFYERPPKRISIAEKQGIPRGERNNTSKPVKDFGTYKVDDWENATSDLGEFIGEGEEAIVFEKDGKVYKAFHNPSFSVDKLGKLESDNPLFGPFNKQLIGEFVKRHINPKNKHSLFEPIKFEGIIDDGYGRMAPVVSQKKLKPAAEGLMTDKAKAKILNKLKTEALKRGYILDKSPYEGLAFSNKHGKIFDLHPWNLGYDENGNIRIFDMMTMSKLKKLYGGRITLEG